MVARPQQAHEQTCMNPEPLVLCPNLHTHDSESRMQLDATQLPPVASPPATSTRLPDASISPAATSAKLAHHNTISANQQVGCEYDSANDSENDSEESDDGEDSSDDEDDYSSDSDCDSSEDEAEFATITPIISSEHNRHIRVRDHMHNSKCKGKGSSLSKTCEIPSQKDGMEKSAEVGALVMRRSNKMITTSAAEQLVGLQSHSNSAVSTLG